jgi:hypothetical protein
MSTVAKITVFSTKYFFAIDLYAVCIAPNSTLHYTDAIITIDTYGEGSRIPSKGVTGEGGDAMPCYAFIPVVLSSRPFFFPLLLLLRSSLPPILYPPLSLHLPFRNLPLPLTFPLFLHSYLLKVANY